MDFAAMVNIYTRSDVFKYLPRDNSVYLFWTVQVESYQTDQFARKQRLTVYLREFR